MADNLYFSRDTKLFGAIKNSINGVKSLAPSAVFEIPILDGFSFSQANNTSEITLSEMENSEGVSRRGRKLFNDSLAPAEWSFSTYVRPFKGAATGSDYDAGQTHAVEELLWANMAGADYYENAASGYAFESNKFGTTPADVTTNRAVTVADSTDLNISFSESNRAVLHSIDLYFVMETNAEQPQVYKLEDAAVNEASLNFEVDGIATIEWSGFAKNIKLLAKDVTPVADEFNRIAGSSATASLAAGAVELLGGADNDLALGGTAPCTDATATHLTVASFNGGSGHSASDTINMMDGSTVTVTAVNAGAVTEFTTTAGDIPFPIGSTISQASATAGTGFSFVTNADMTSNVNSVQVAKDEGVSSTSNFIRNRLTQLSVAALDTTTFDAVNYNFTLTGGSITISNNIEYLTPEEIGKVNLPLENVTGSRTVTGSFTCYMNFDDAANTGTSTDFFNDMKSADALDIVTNQFDLEFNIGGTSGVRLQANMPKAHMEIPVNSIEDVISYEVNFHGLGSNITGTDEIDLIYYGQ
jgi:hypothetical protein